MTEKNAVLSAFKIDASAPFVVFLLGIILRWAVSLNTYSGYGKPPMYGDYEAQRHWMEITVNLPMEAWYRNSSDNDLLYWGLDYPPVTAYHSYVNGKVAEFLNSSWNALHHSRGLQNAYHKVFMRTTVMISDLFIYVPVLALFYFKSRSLPFSNEIFGEKSVVIAFLCALLDPSIILIDHGHFQYNCVSLGLALWAVHAFSGQRLLVGSILFCLALNYKQMELYHSVPIFVYLLKQCYLQRSFFAKFSLLLKLGVTVIISFVLSWLPFLLLSDKEGIFQIVGRIFPFNRGLFEDKVANIWCSLHPILRLKEVQNQSSVVHLCLGTTILSIVPDCILLWRNATSKNLLMGLTSTSLSFFLFSYHVHEKSILLATAPASLLLIHHPRIFGWFIVIATGSMFPLLHKDGLTLPTISLVTLFLIICHILIDSMESRNPKNFFWLILPYMASISVMGMAFFCALHLEGERLQGTSCPSSMQTKNVKES